MQYPTESNGEGEAKPRIHPGTYWLIAFLMLGGLPVLMKYREHHNQSAREQYNSLHGLGPTVRPPLVGKLERDLEATNWDGQPVKLGTLRGKLWIGGYFYTDCPSGCDQMAKTLDRLRQEIGQPDRFHVVSFSVNSPADTQEKVAAFFQRNAVEAPNWWYLTAPDERIAKYVTKYFQFPPTRVLTDPEKIRALGPIEHDVRIVLVDGIANVRGYYRPTDPKIGELDYGRLKREIHYLLENELSAAPSSATPTDS